jgi:hypothetical protein
VKGSKQNHGVTVAYLESLLTKDTTIELNQEKWFRNITESLINIRSTLYTLKVTENKRQLVYLDDIFVDTNIVEVSWNSKGSRIPPNVQPLIIPAPVHSSLKGKRLGVTSSRETREECTGRKWGY